MNCRENFLSRERPMSDRREVKPDPSSGCLSTAAIRHAMTREIEPDPGLVVQAARPAGFGKPGSGHLSACIPPVLAEH